MTEDKIYDIVNDLIDTHETKNPFRIAKELGAIILTVPLIRVNGFYQRSELPLVDWYPDNSTLISRALSQF